jgi:hypothetical protein
MKGDKKEKGAFVRKRLLEKVGDDLLSRDMQYHRPNGA